MLRGYFRNAGVLGVAEVLLRAKTLVLLPILTRAFGAVDFGTWAQVSVIVSMLTPLMLLGAENAAVRFLPGQAADEVRRGLATLLAHFVLVSVAVGFLLWLLAAPIAALFFEGEQNAPLVALCGFVVLSALCLSWCRIYYRLGGSGKGFTVINLSQSTIGTVISAVIAVAGGSVSDVVFFGAVADLLLAGGVIGTIAFRGGLGRPDFGEFVRFVRYGIRLVPLGYAYWVVSLSDRVLIAHFGDLQDVGVYSVAYGLGYSLIGLIFNPIWLMYPVLAAEMYNQGRLDDLKTLYRQSTRAALGLLVPAMVGMGVLSVPLFRALTTEEFVRGAPLAPIITLGYVFLMMSSYYDISLGLVGRQTWSTISFAVAAVVNVLMNVLLLPPFGIIGSALATTLAFGSQLAISWYVGTREIRLNFDLSFLAKACSASLGMALFLSLLYPFSTDGLAGIALASAAGAVVYLVLMLALRAVGPAEWRQVLAAAGLERAERIAVVRLALGIRAAEQ